MGCTNEEYRTRSYENIKRLAEMSLGLVQDNIVIYQYDKNLFYFCCETDYSEKKGVKIKVLENHRRHTAV